MNARLLVLAAVFVTGLYAADVYTDNVVIVLDASGSMGERMHKADMRRIDAAKAALKEVLKHVPTSTHVGLLVFSGRGIADKWVYPLGPRDDATLMSAIDLPHPAGRTPLGRFMKIGADRLLTARGAQHGYGTYRLLIVTDGQASDQELVERYTPELIGRGITVDVIGVDMKQDHMLATRVHSYRRADDPAALTRAVADVFAEVSAAADNGTTSEEAFELLAGFPDEAAVAVVESLAASGNHPIGTRLSTQAVAQAADATQQAQPRAAVPGPHPAPGRSKKRGGIPGPLVILIVVVVLAVASKAGRRS